MVTGKRSWTLLCDGDCIFKQQTIRVSPAQQSNHELNKDTNEHAKVYGEKLRWPQPYRKNYKLTE